MASIGDLYTWAALLNTQLCSLSYTFLTGWLTSSSSERVHCNLADGSDVSGILPLPQMHASVTLTRTLTIRPTTAI